GRGGGGAGGERAGGGGGAVCGRVGLDPAGPGGGKPPAPRHGAGSGNSAEELAPSQPPRPPRRTFLIRSIHGAYLHDVRPIGASRLALAWAHLRARAKCRINVPDLLEERHVG